MPHLHQHLTHLRVNIDRFLGRHQRNDRLFLPRKFINGVHQPVFQVGQIFRHNLWDNFLRFVFVSDTNAAIYQFVGNFVLTHGADIERLNSLVQHALFNGFIFAFRFLFRHAHILFRSNHVGGFKIDRSIIETPL
ncbi:MAG: hypothetical protein BWX80_00368 [Candidatus Hydrogenedentes bacterium ADurb.Bin101]|nr:MAG: hypothetical protein BWX80_00368 [Candidatus Hydrogenedentes bacterium ADurb.Bin101]